VLAYTLAASGKRDEALALARDLTRMLAADIVSCGAMHECYDGDTGRPLSSESKGFVSWNALVATLADSIERGIDPFAAVTKVSE